MARQIEGIFSDGYDTDEFCDEPCFGKIYLDGIECEDVGHSCHKCFIKWLESEVTNDN